MKGVRKRRRTVGGKTRADKKYSYDTRNHRGTTCMFTLCTDKAASVTMARNIARLIDYRRAGEMPDAALSKWLEQIPDQLREKLHKCDLISAARTAAGRDLEKMSEEYRLALEAKGSRRHAVESPRRAMRVFKECGFKRLSDVEYAPVAKWTDARIREGLSPSGVNGYIRAVKGFGSYAKKMDYLGANPLEHLPLRSVEADLRHPRGALDEVQLRLLLDTTRSQDGKVNGMTGPERTLLYWTAAETSLRWGGLYSLTVGQFHMGEAIPFVRLFARHDKGKKQRDVALRPELVAALQEAFTGRDAAERAFPSMWIGHGARMLRHDLAAAGLPYQDANGLFYDFHSLRSVAPTLMARNGVPLQAAQHHLGHHDPKLTAKFYTKHTLQSQATQLGKIPSLAPRTENLLSTTSATPTDTSPEPEDVQ